MHHRLLGWRRLFKPEPRHITVPIADCVHYSGFQYGGSGFNPYQQYMTALHRGTSIGEARKAFIGFLRTYRPRHMGEALGAALSKAYPLWTYPWNRFSSKAFHKGGGWYDDPNKLPDILTSYSEQGILSFRIDQEFYWIENAFYNIKTRGYQPQKYSYAHATHFYKNARQSRYLLLDGNHRAAAMAVLGHSSIQVAISPARRVREDDCERWFGVTEGYFTRDDALLIFNAYFERGESFVTTSSPAPVLAPNQWWDWFD